MENYLDSLDDFNNNFKKYIEQKQNQIIYYNRDNLIGEENKKDLICPICLDVLKIQ